MFLLLFFNLNGEATHRERFQTFVILFLRTSCGTCAERHVPAVWWEGTQAFWHTRAVNGNMTVQLEWQSLIALAELMSLLIGATATSQNVTSQTVNSAGLQVGIQSLRQERTKLQCKAAEEKCYGWMDFYFFLWEALKKTKVHCTANDWYAKPPNEKQWRRCFCAFQHLSVYKADNSQDFSANYTW